MIKGSRAPNQASDGTPSPNWTASSSAASSCFLGLRTAIPKLATTGEGGARQGREGKKLGDRVHLGAMGELELATMKNDTNGRPPHKEMGCR